MKKDNHLEATEHRTTMDTTVILAAIDIKPGMADRGNPDKKNN